MTIDQIIEATMLDEGGFSDDPRDPGGVTNFGQTIPWLTDLYGRPATRQDVISLTHDTAKANYLKFATKSRITDVAAISSRVAYVLFDYGVNSGLTNAIRAMQRALDTTPDGVIGSRTLERLSQVVEAEVVTEMVASRLEIFARIARNSHPYIYGWLMRQARQLRSLW